MKLIYFIIAFIFFFNPEFSNLDILPDFIGYALIMLALSRQAYINENAQDAYDSARIMLIISIAKTVSLALVSAEDVTMSLLLSFTFLIVELIFGIPFVLKLFNYLSGIALSGMNGIWAEKTNKYAYFTIGIMIARLTLAMLPDLTALTINNGVDTDALPLLTGFRPTLFIVSGAISLVACTVWLVLIEIFIVRLVNKSVREKCLEDYKQQLSTNTSLFEARNSMVVMLMFVFASVFAFDFRYMQYVVTPDFLLTFIAIIGFTVMLIKGYQRISFQFIAFCVTFVGQVVFTVLEIVAAMNYYNKFSLEQIGEMGAQGLYDKISIFAGISSIFSIASVFLFVWLVNKCGRNTLVAKKELFQGCDFSYQLEEYDKKTKINLILTSAFAIISGIVYFLRVYMLPQNQDLIFLGYITELALIVVLIKSILFVSDDVYKRIKGFSFGKVFLSRKKQKQETKQGTKN